MDISHPGPVVNIRGVDVAYNGYIALEDIDLVVEKLDFLGIIGPNGGGKSTLLKVILGLIKPSSGTVEVLGASPARARTSIGYVAQHQDFDRRFPATIWDVVLMGRLSHAGLLHGYGAQDKQSAASALKTVGMYEQRKRSIGELSGGQQQRVLIARALVTDHRLLLLDEPMSGVDSAMQKGLYDLLADLNRNMTIVMVSHDISSVSRYVKKIACLNRELYYHGSGELSARDLESAYRCPVELIAHGVPHRVLREHSD